MKKIRLISLVIIIINMFSCRTMMLNQKADILPKGQAETAGNVSATVAAVIPGTVIPAYSVGAGFQQRFGINKRTEMQFLVNTDITLGAGFAFYYNLNLYSKVNPKFLLLKKDNFALSILPHVGFDINYHPDLYIEPLTGFQLIFSHDKPSIYYGLLFEIGENVYNIPEALIDLSVGLSFGYEGKKPFLMRHEFGVVTSIDFINYSGYRSIGLLGPINPYNEVGPMVNSLVIDFYYSFGFGGRYGYTK